MHTSNHTHCNKDCKECKEFVRVVLAVPRKLGRHTSNHAFHCCRCQSPLALIEPHSLKQFGHFLRQPTTGAEGVIRVDFSFVVLAKKISVRKCFVCQ